LRGLLATASALLVAPKAGLKRLLSLPAPGGRFYHFARRTWIDGEEVFGGSVQSCRDVTIGDGFYQAIGSDQGSISFWVAPPDEAPHFDGMIDEVEVHGSEISWTRMSDDSPFEPPARTDPPPTIESDVGEGEDLVDSWW